MENAKWCFTKEQLENSPSRRSGIEYNRELSYRQQAANFIQDMGQRLSVSQLCINTAIVYMHRYFMRHSFADVHRNNIAVAALLLSTKVENQPRKIEYILKVAHVCLHNDATLDVRSKEYSERLNEVVFHENFLLQTLGFDSIVVEHPNMHVVKICEMVKASSDLSKTSYIMATTSLHMTTMCLMYKPTVVACVCIHLACKWSSYKIEPCTRGKDWFYYVDKTLTKDLLEKLTQEFISILEGNPNRFKEEFAKDAASGYNGPSSITVNESSLLKESSPCTGSDFEEKRALENPSSYQPPTPSSQPVAGPSVKRVEQPSLAVKGDALHHLLKLPQRPNTNNVPLPSTSTSSSRHPVPAKVEVAPKLPVVSMPKSRFNFKPMVLPPLPPVPSLLPLPQVPRGLGPIKDVKTNGAKEEPTTHHENDVLSRKTPEEKHNRHSSSNSTKDQSMVSIAGTGIKVKIPREMINLSYTKAPLKIIPTKPPIKDTPPPPPVRPQPPVATTPTLVPPLKLVLTKDKSGSYSTSQHKHNRGQKRAHPDSSSHKNSQDGMPPFKYHQFDHIISSLPKTFQVDQHRPLKVYLTPQQRRDNLFSAKG